MTETFISLRTLEAMREKQSKKPAWLHRQQLVKIDTMLAKPTCTGELRTALVAAREWRLRWLCAAPPSGRQLPLFK